MRRFLILLAALLLPASALAHQVETTAKACIIIDAASGRTLLEHNAQAPLPMASTTKVMTALLALEQGDLSSTVTCGRNAFGVPGTSIYLALGEKLTLEQMLYGLMLSSGNDAAVAIAEHIGSSVEDFCRMMTQRADDLGCADTVFLTPHGLPCEGHHTTARDLALIAREAMKHDTFRTIVSTRRATIPWAGHDYDRVLNNKNKLLATYPGATGIKTGYTKAAGRCLVFGAERSGMEIIGVVLNCADWFSEAAALMDTAFAEYERCTLMLSGESIRTLPVDHANGAEVGALLTADLSAIVPKGALPQIEIDLPQSLEAPVQAGQVVGEVLMRHDGQVLCAVPLVAAEDIARDDFASRWQTFVQGWPLMVK